MKYLKRLIDETINFSPTSSELLFNEIEADVKNTGYEIKFGTPEWMAYQKFLKKLWNESVNKEPELVIRNFWEK